MSEPTIVVAEIGINHSGYVKNALRMMTVAKECGATLCKFQKRTIHLVYSEEELARPRESPFGTTNGDLKRGLELSFDDYCEIDAHSCAIGLPWFASAWDVPSVAFLDAFEVPYLKVASACLTDMALLVACKETGIPVVLSTGMSTLEEMDRAVITLGDSLQYLLHCTATYPCALDEINLRCIGTLWDRYPPLYDGSPYPKVGFSSHSVSPWPALCAVAMGAEMVEAHLTLDRTAFGSDQAASLEPQAFAKLVTEIRDFETARGDGIKKVYPSEEPIKAKLRRVVA